MCLCVVRLSKSRGTSRDSKAYTCSVDFLLVCLSLSLCSACEDANSNNNRKADRIFVPKLKRHINQSKCKGEIGRRPKSWVGATTQPQHNFVDDERINGRTGRAMAEYRCILHTCIHTSVRIKCQFLLHSCVSHEIYAK